MKTIIIGGGRAGKELAAQLPNAVIIESNPAKKAQLERLGGVEVVIGDGSDEELLKQVGLYDVGTFISLTSDDDVNYRAAAIAKRYGVPRIIVRVEDPEDQARFEELGVESIMLPAKLIANLVMNLIRCPKDVDIPFNRILVPILNEKTLEKAFKEALLIASVARAELTVIASPDIDRREMEMLAMELGVRLRILMEEEHLMQIIKRHLRYHGCIILERVEEHRCYPDCIIIDQEELGFMDRLLGRSIVLKLIRCASRPVLVARTFRYYERILAIIDSHDSVESVCRYSFLLAHLCGAEIELLILSERGGSNR